MHKLINLNHEIAKYDEYYYKSDLSDTYKENRNTIIEVISVFSQIQIANIIDEKAIGIIRNGLCESWSVIFHDCTGYLVAKFEPQYQILADLIIKLSNSKKWLIRRNIIIISPMLKNTNLRNQILINGLSDRSSKCREYSFDRITYANKEQAVTTLLEQIRIGNDIKKNEKLIKKIELLQNGYTILSRNDHFISIQNQYSVFSIPITEYNKMSENDLINKYRIDA